MTDKKNIFLYPVRRIGIPAFHLIQPPAPGNIPVFKTTDERITGTTTGNINIKRSIGKLVIEADIKFLCDKVEIIAFAPFFQDRADTTHALVGLAFIEIQDCYFYG